MSKFVLIIFLLPALLFPKSITLEYCIKKSVEKSPQQVQKIYYEQINKTEKTNNSANFYPGFSFDAQATYQSDVFKLPLDLPVNELLNIAKDQYKINLNLNWLIWDGGVSSALDNKSDIDMKLNKSNLNVSLFKIKELVSAQYFRVLLINKNIEILNSYIERLDTNLKILDVYFRNGVILKSNISILQIEKNKIHQTVNSLKFDKDAALKMLSLWLDDNIDESTLLEIPEISISENLTVAGRPEFELFKIKEEQTGTAKKVTSTQLNPKFFLFAQGGYGSPNPFNFFDDGTYYLVGLKAQWTPFDWGTTSRKEEILDISEKITTSEKENFEKNLNLSLINAKNDIGKYDELIKSDDDIITLQKQITDERFSMLRNGVITSTDYVINLNQLLQSELNKQLHDIQKRLSINTYIIQSGN